MRCNRGSEYGAIFPYLIPIFLAVFPLLFLSGCSSIAVRHPLNWGRFTQTPLTIVACIKASAQQNIINKKFSKQKNKIVFNSEIKMAKKDIRLAMDTVVHRLKNIEIRYQQVCVDAPKGVATEAVTVDAPLYLEIDLTGYGSLKAKWKRYLIGSGIVEGVVQGAVVYSATQNLVLGLGVALEEFTSEYLTWNGVDWFLGGKFAPVTLEGILKRRSDNKTIWRDTEFITSNKKELKKLSREERTKKEKQLLASLHRAEDKLFKSLDNYLQAEFADSSRASSIAVDTDVWQD